MSRRTATVIASLAVGLAMSSAPLFAAEVTGVLVDEACYNSNKANITNAHKDMGETCATECAKKGNQVALVTKSGEVYQVMAMGALAGEKNAKLVPHMSHTVTLTGDIMNGAAGKPKMIHATALKMVSQ
ncbi:MAG TPA: hypothetical protein VJP86_05885 [Vicinamibacterales bacterium]|nr:hypothetical protein [Vicinamibacterales bacterium]